jgi:hypothetical protein
MRQVNDLVLSGLDSGSVNGSQLDTNQLINMSFHCVISDSTAAGTFKLQASNDVAPIQISGPDFVVTNWVDIPNESITMTAGKLQGILSLSEMSFRWVRAVYTETTPGTGTVIVNRFAQGA